MSEGLLEYADAEGLTATSAFIESLSGKVKQRLQQISSTTSGADVPATSMVQLAEAEEEEAAAGCSSSRNSSEAAGKGGDGQQGLRKRGIAKLEGTDVVTKDLHKKTSGQHRHGLLRRQPSFTQAARAAVHGFPRHTEEQYRDWRAVHYR
jgi:hypothetical protein